MKKLTLGFTFLILIFSCNQKQPELESLWKQTSPNGKVVIYKYNYQSMMAFGSGKHGNKIAEKFEEFSDNLEEVPFTFISSWGNNDTLRTIQINTEGLKSTKPITSTKQIKSVIVKKQNYSVLAQRSCFYTFNSFKIKDDSISFQIDSVLMGSKSQIKSKFPLGPVYANNDKDLLKNFSVRELVKKGNKMEQLIHKFTPVNTISLDSIPNKGIFKRVTVKKTAGNT